MSEVVRKRVERRESAMPRVIDIEVRGITTTAIRSATFGRTMRCARELRGLSQLELAARSGLSRATIVAIESDSANADMRLSTLERVIEALDAQIVIRLGNAER